MKNIFIYPVIIFAFISCKEGKEANMEEVVTNDRTTTTEQTPINQLESTEEILPEMPLSGLAQNLKGGATVESNGQRFWIDGLASWDDHYADKPVKVWGEIVIRYDAPVFMDTSELVSQGIPVYSEEEMKEKSKRYWIINPKYELIRP